MAAYSEEKFLYLQSSPDHSIHRIDGRCVQRAGM